MIFFKMLIFNKINKVIMKYVMILLCLIVVGTANAQYNIGDKVDDFSLKGTDGKLHSIVSDGGERGTVIIFTCNHCPYAVLYEDRIKALQAEYKQKGIHIIAINPNDPRVVPDDSYENMIIRAKEKAFNFPYLWDESQLIYPKFGASRTPEVYLIDSENILHYMGAIDDNARDPSGVEIRYLSNAIDSLLSGRKINTTKTKAIGCSIKTQ